MDDQQTEPNPTLNPTAEYMPSLFKMDVGDCVQLTCGGWAMTIEMTNQWRTSCVWFDNNGQMHRDSIPTKCLMAAEPRF